jgi:hypothetical protein
MSTLYKASNETVLTVTGKPVEDSRHRAGRREAEKKITIEEALDGLLSHV